MEKNLVFNDVERFEEIVKKLNDLELQFSLKLLNFLSKSPLASDLKKNKSNRIVILEKIRPINECLPGIHSCTTCFLAMLVKLSVLQCNGTDIVK